MKVLQVIDTLNTGGAEKVCLDLITLLSDAGHEVDCLIISERGSLFSRLDPRSTPIMLNREWKYSLIKLYKCARIISKYDIVHIHMRHTWMYVRLASLLFHSKSILLFHDHYWEVKIGEKISFHLRGLFKPKRYIGISRKHIEWAKNSLHLDEEKVFLLPNIVIPNYNKSDKYSGDLVLVANLRQIKNIKYGIHLANLWKRQLIIFGNHDGSAYASEVMQSAESSEYVKIIQNESNIQPYLHNFRIALHTSFCETGPLVLLEYLAHGLPFISFNSGHVADQIRDELPFCIAERYDDKEWSHKLSCIEDQLRLNEASFKDSLKTVFQKYFSPDQYSTQCQKIYQSVLDY